MEMSEKPKNPRLEVDDRSVKWITPWAKCVVNVDDDDDLTITTSMISPVFTENEWQRFCAAVNKNLNQIERTNHDVSSR